MTTVASTTTTATSNDQDEINFSLRYVSSRYVYISILAGSTQLTTSTNPSVSVMSPSDFIKACEQPVAIGTAVSMITMLPINLIAMFTLFTKIEKLFNPSQIATRQRQQAFTHRMK